MSDEKTFTQRELVLAQREAWVNGRSTGILAAYADAQRAEWSGEAVRRYPLPTVTRQRVVADPDMWDGVQFKSDGCNLYWRKGGGDWLRYPDRMAYRDLVPFPTKQRVALWADLFINPTETISDDES